MRIGFTLCISLFCFISLPCFSQNISGVVNLYRKVLWADSAKGELKLTDVSGFSGYMGRKVMVIQMQGVTMNGGSSTADASFGNITAINDAGYYEIGTICGFLNDTMILERKLNNHYDVTGAVQCVIMPVLTGSVTVVDTVRAAAWDPVADTGGVIAMEVNGNLYLNKPISAAGKGFNGGVHTQYGSTCNFNPVPPPTDYYMPYLANAAKTGGYKGEGIADYISGKQYARGNQVNGGGGGNNHNAGGGGGSNYSSGGVGGERVTSVLGECKSNGAGRGGLALSSYGYANTPATLNRIFMGGGGGAGHDNDGYGMPGGNGGGIIYIKANSIIGNSATAADNKIIASGSLPSRFLPAPFSVWSTASASDGSGGGGGGGTVILNTPSFTGNAITVEVMGGNGGNSEMAGNAQCSGPGGGGGGGVVWFSAAPFPSGVTSNQNGGSPGIVQFSASACNGSTNSATGGNVGVAIYNFAIAAPRDSSPVCKSVLPIDVRISLSGQIINDRRVFAATVSDPQNVRQCILERSVNGNFSAIDQENDNGQDKYSFSDANGVSAVYRAKLVTKSGNIFYSSSLHFSVKQTRLLSIEVFPNPARDKITAQVYVSNAGISTMVVSDVFGRIFQKKELFFSKGLNSVEIPLTQLPGGMLIIKAVKEKSIAFCSILNLSH